jgi:hypothetical protein
LQAIISRQVALGSLDVRVPKEGKVFWKQSEAQRRLDFIHDFYDYIHDGKGYGQQTWTQWIKSRPTT